MPKITNSVMKIYIFPYGGMDFKKIYSRPLFIIIFRTKILFSGSYFILTGHTKVESVAYDGVKMVASLSVAGALQLLMYIRRPVQSTDEAVPSFFYFRIS